MAELTRAIVDAEHYVARYARGGLSDAEREAFEQFCLMNPDVARDVATDRVLLVGLQEIESTPRRTMRRGWNTLALAAGIAAIALVFGVREYVLTTQPATLEIVAGTALPGRSPMARLRVMTLREPIVHRVALAPDQDLVELRIYPDATRPSRNYTASIEGRLGDRLVSAIKVTGLQPDEKDDDALTLVIRIPDRKDATLRISIAGENGVVGQFDLRVTHRS